MNTSYPSGIDTWIAAVLIGSPLLAIGSGVYALSESTVAGMTQIGIGLTTGVVMKLLAWPCYYRLDPKVLKIKCGLLEENVPFERIKSVERSSSLWSAPALSLKRVKIVLDDGFRLVSPRDRDGFIEALRQKIGN